MYFGTGLRPNSFSSSCYQILPLCLQLPTSGSPFPPAPARRSPGCHRGSAPSDPCRAQPARDCAHPPLRASSPPCCRPHPWLQQHPQNIAHPTTWVTAVFCRPAAFSFSTRWLGHNVPQPVHVFLDKLCMQLPPALNPTISGMKTNQIWEKLLKTLNP